MQIGGFQKLTLLDFPRQVACIVFTAGCNLSCPFCHNAGLLTGAPPAPASSEEEILAYLKKRQGLLDGVVLSGGEPLLQPDIAQWIRKIRTLGYLVKLDTNGGFPQQLSALLCEGLLDYVAMDIKHRPERYGDATGRATANILPAVEESIALLQASGISFEFRTTLVRGIHEAGDAAAMAQWIAGDHPYFLQSYEDSGDVLRPEGLSAFSPEELEDMLCAVRVHCPGAALRSR